ncbi:hypothetical protein RND71_034431 [Anisodus tanguticus]|uniref:Uncharacterized protein n=1 Tax=Anisodus tanguticus TaxID=243964 RepID=A0AAE1RCN1_9SOLA|nr:hypothetical protein RND71_034431 [Anisodus tanguticus]
MDGATPPGQHWAHNECRRLDPCKARVRWPRRAIVGQHYTTRGGSMLRGLGFPMPWENHGHIMGVINDKGQGLKVALLGKSISQVRRHKASDKLADWTMRIMNKVTDPEVKDFTLRSALLSPGLDPLLLKSFNTPSQKVASSKSGD